MKKLFSDSSSISLFFSNVFTILLAIFQNWNASTIMVVYWSQSVIIGLFNFFRILFLKSFSTEGLSINGQPALPAKSTQVHIAFFFAFHYGFFHFVYLIFLIAEAKLPIDIVSVAIGSGIFFINHFFSYLHNRQTDSQVLPNIGNLMFSPYGRIIPMHITLIIGALLDNRSVLFVFLGLKTLVDLFSHTLKHAMPSSPRLKPS